MEISQSERKYDLIEAAARPAENLLNWFEKTNCK
jgi:hypothetical protein